MLYLELFHGRTDPNQEMDDWGTLGPIFGIEHVNITYGAHIKLQSEDDELFSELFVNDQQLIHYDGVFYGDICIFTDLNEEMKPRLQKFDQSKVPEKGNQP